MRKDPSGAWIAAFQTPVGTAGAAGRGRILLGAVLPGSGGRAEVLERLRSGFPGAREGGPDAKAVARAIARFVGGEGGRQPRGPSIHVSLAGRSPFRAAAWRWMASIPRGKAATYGAVASWLGRPGAARAVGAAAAANPLPLVVPCHRVVGADGSLTGFSSRGGIEQKRRLLEAEGVEFLPGSPPRVRKECLLFEPPPRPKGLRFEGETGCRRAPRPAPSEPAGESRGSGADTEPSAMYPRSGALGRGRGRA